MFAVCGVRQLSWCQSFCARGLCAVSVALGTTPSLRGPPGCLAYEVPQQTFPPTHWEKQYKILPRAEPLTETAQTREPFRSVCVESACADSQGETFSTDPVPSSDEPRIR